MNKAIYFIAAGIAALIMSVLIIKADTPDTTPVVISESQASARISTGYTIPASLTAIQSDVNEASKEKEAIQVTAAEKTVSAESIPDKSSSSGLININNADISALVTLKGIGEKKAAAIIEYRESNGGFSTIDDIKNVKGIGEKTFENIKDFISV